jgi:ribosomal protein L37E
MIFRNPAGAPELACNGCGCRWFDRRKNACYECGEPAPEEEVRAFEEALAEFQAARSNAAAAPAQSLEPGG